ncbi:alpha-galactosidase [Rhodoferax sp. OV413]|uniref:alpha-galactosidase n=1 Tax=Rhodoferax sp. OV413 TaxID=1855285 RepID=UPI001C54CEB4|nr:alpha-galactosidase [Rhodoferax sp. OV413]
MSRLLRLDGQNVSVVLEFALGQMPVWRHFGARLPDTLLLHAWPAARLQRLAPGTLDRLGGLPVLPCFGNGELGAPALRVHRAGLDAVQDLRATGFAQPDPQTLQLTLEDAVASISVQLFLHLCADSDVLSLHSVLHNTGSTPLTLDHLASATVPMPAALQELGSFHGQWSHEFQWTRQAVPQVGWQRDNRSGRSSHEAPPAVFVLASDAGEHTGEVVAAQLAWSGNHRFALDRADDGRLNLQAGEWFAPGEVQLAPGTSLATPLLHLGWSKAGLNGASARLQRYIRSQVLQWPGGRMRARPVHLNTWEAVYFDHQADVLFDLARAAASVGVERFVLDDGWFPARKDDRAGLGDWWPDPAKYPEGLGPLIAHVHSLGMEFGLWVEPEMVNPDSELFRAHPDWALQLAGRALVLGRNQLVLDLSRPEVSAYLFDKLHAVLAAHPIAYLKWDMNRIFAHAAGQDGRLAMRSQIPALYALLERLRAAHPQLEIETCASGGGRADLGMLRHTQRLWTSDNNDAVSRVAIQSGAARLFPLELMGSHVGPAPAHATGRSQSMAFRCAVACFGHMGVEADVRQLGEADRATLAHWIALHKSLREVLHSGRFSQGRTVDGVVWWLVQTAGQAVLGVFTVSPPNYSYQPGLRLPSLAGSGAWQARLLGSAGQARARGDAPDVWGDALRSGGGRVQGEELAQVGWPVPVMHPESALVYSFSSVPASEG